MSSKGRTELRKSLSGAKNAEEAAGDVRFCVAPQKMDENLEKPIFWSDFFREKKNPASKNQTSGIVWNAFWQSFAAVRAMFEG